MWKSTKKHKAIWTTFCGNKKESIVWGLLILVSLGWILTACQSSEGSASLQPPLLPRDSEVLARVGGEPVSRYDVEQSAKETLGVVGEAILQSKQEGKIVEGLAARKAMAKLRWEAMSPVERMAVEKKVAAFRERLLAKEYIDAKASNPRVSEEDIQAYYDKHSERFGARELKTFEMLFSDLERSGSPGKAARLKQLGELEPIQEWSATSRQPTYKGWLQWRSGDAELGSLHPKLRKKVTAMSPGEKSGVILIENTAYLLRVKGTKKQLAKPLSTVRKDIEEILRPRAYRDAVRHLKGNALKQVGVTYTKKP